MTSNDARARAPRRDAAENRLAILTAARSVLAADPEAPLDAVVSAAGLTRRAFYGHFSSREAMRVELARSGAERVTAAVLGCARPDSRVTLALIAARLWDEVDDVRLLTRQTVFGPHRSDIAEQLAPLRALVLDTARRGIESAELRQDMPAELLAKLIESSALAVLDLATQSSLPRQESRLLAIRSVLSTAGLSWSEIAELLATVQLEEPTELRGRDS
jgi:AcrR family transcriptional regulator